MCLIINTSIHEEKIPYRGRKLPKPFIVKQDIHCLKVLKFSEFLGMLLTPFTNHRVLFNNGVSTIEIEKTKKKIPFGFEYDRYGKYYLIHEGVHSYYEQDRVDAYKSDKRCHILDAVIPKGTMVYFGHSGDIVGEKLMVFQNKDKYLEYAENNDVFDLVSWEIKNPYIPGI